MISRAPSGARPFEAAPSRSSIRLGAMGSIIPIGICSPPLGASPPLERAGNTCRACPMVQHTVPKGFKRIRYYGVQATKTFAKVKVMIQAALAKVEGIVKGAVKIIARLTYRQRYEQSTGRDPLRCPHCQSEMEVWRIWHPTYVVIYDEGEVIKRGTYASSAPRAGP